MTGNPPLASRTARPTGGYDPVLFDRLARLEDRSFWFRARNRLIVDLVRERSAPGNRFLELGCGTGYVLQAVVRQCGLRGTGIELYSDGLRHARSRVPEADLVELDATDTQYRDEFDLAGAFDVLEHVEDDLALLRVLQRAVRPGGWVLLTVPQHPWLWSAADVNAGHIRRYRRAELLDLVRRAELTPVQVTSFVTALLPAMAVSRLRNRRPRPSFDPLAGLVVPAPVSQLFEFLLDGERALIRRGMPLPAGGSLVVVARR